MASDPAWLRSGDAIHRGGSAQDVVPGDHKNNDGQSGSKALQHKGFGRWIRLPGTGKRGSALGGEPKKRVTSDFALVPKHLMGHVEVSVRYSPIPRRMNQSGDAGSVSDDFPLTAIRQRTDVELTVEQRKSYMALLTRGIR